MQNAECRMQNDLTTLRFAHKERMYKRGTRSAEYGTTLLREATQTRKLLYYYPYERSATKRSPFCILHSAFCIQTRSKRLLLELVFFGASIHKVKRDKKGFYYFYGIHSYKKYVSWDTNGCNQK